MCPPENIETINRDMLFTYLRHQCTPDQLVLAGSGMPHEQLVDLAEQYFTMYVSEVVFFLLNTHVCRVICLVIGWFFVHLTNGVIIVMIKKLITSCMLQFAIENVRGPFV